MEGAVDTAVFRTYVAQVLGPTLKPGDIVVLDNLAVHKVAGIAEAIAARGARLEPLPPYSPEFNPIEHCWAKLKTALRQAGARTRRRLDAALKRTLKTITPADALAWFTHCGYPVYSQVIRYSVLSQKFVEEIIDLEDSSRLVIPARLNFLEREESGIPGPFVRG